MARPARVFLAAELLLGIAWFLLPDSPPRAAVYCTLGLAMVAAVVVGTRLHRPSHPLYSGPSPVASLASVLVGLQVNQARGRSCGPPSGSGPGASSTHLEKLGAFTLNRSGFPIVEMPLADPDARLLFILGDLAWSAIAVLAARRLVRPPGPLPPP